MIDEKTRYILNATSNWWNHLDSTEDNSGCREGINEEELDKLAKKYIKNSDFNNDTEEYYRRSWIEEEAFKAGYRKGWEDKK